MRAQENVDLPFEVEDQLELPPQLIYVAYGYNYISVVIIVDYKAISNCWITKPFFRCQEFKERIEDHLQTIWWWEINKWRESSSKQSIMMILFFCSSSIPTTTDGPDNVQPLPKRLFL